MTFAEADHGQEIPRLKRIERVVLIMEDKSRRNEGSRQKGRSVGSLVERSAPRACSPVGGQNITQLSDLIAVTFNRKEASHEG